MLIKRFQIQGYKSNKDLTIEGLSDINILYGLNDVGKSNIFEALALWYRVFSSESDQYAGSDIGAFAFSLGQEQKIRLEADIQSREVGTLNTVVNVVQVRSHSEYSSEAHLTKPDARKSVPYKYSDGEFDVRVHVIDAARRVHVEQREIAFLSSPIRSHNLKQALFYAYLSSNIEQKQRLNAIKNILVEPPFSLGELDIALDPETDTIDVGFVRPAGRLPIRNLGSGPQQILLILGQVFLNDYPIIALEEPEMNLSPQYQEYLMIALRKLMQDPAVKLQQLFISTHSPFFEFTENFYHVTFDPEKGTKIEQATPETHSRHFAMTPVGPDSGARLNSLNQVELYDGVIQDLGLQWGDLVVFVRNDAGQWEVRSANEISDELQVFFDNESES